MIKRNYVPPPFLRECQLQNLSNQNSPAKHRIVYMNIWEEGENITVSKWRLTRNLPNGQSSASHTWKCTQEKLAS